MKLDKRVVWVAILSGFLWSCQPNYQANRLNSQKSPYLLQHSENPIWWQPWTKNTIDYAKKNNKLIFLSIGYSTCHWCHVMERESFETLEVADILNKSFVAVKVDREERPEVDKRYMNALHLLGKRGGWPLTMFLTPKLEPIWGTTYLPKDQLIKILDGFQDRWAKGGGEFKKAGNEIGNYLNSVSKRELGRLPVNESLLQRACAVAEKTFDNQYGGFGPAPKFPSPMRLRLLLRLYKRVSNPNKRETLKTMIEKTLIGMFRGGIYDHIGGGFARYSTDKLWLIPHFEKMLYDNALLALTYLEAFKLFKKPVYAEVAREVLNYVTREMTSKEGPFFSSEDADSEGEEGKFYVWKKSELEEILNPEEFKYFQKFFMTTANGNFENKTNQLNILSSDRAPLDRFEPKLNYIRSKIFKKRNTRVKPLKDKKFLTAWNGLMIGALARGAEILGEPKFLEVSKKAALFIKENLYDEGKLYRRYTNKKTKNFGLLDDYAYLIDGLLHLYEVDLDSKILKWAIDLQIDQDKLLWSKKLGVYYFSTVKEDFPFQIFELADNARPNSNSVSALNLLKIYGFTYDEGFLKKAKSILKAISKSASTYPLGFSQGLLASNYFLDKSKEVVIVGKRNNTLTKQFLSYFKENFSPNNIVYFKESDKEKPNHFIPEPVVNKKMIDGKTTVYVCQNSVCKYPTSELKVFKQFMNSKIY